MAAFGKRVAKRHATSGADKIEEMVVPIRGASLLLVEDNEINQQVAREVLEGAGFSVTIANYGPQGVEAVKAGNYHAVLMDIQMPVMGGYTASKTIRQDKQFDDLPIIAMTASAMAGDRDKAISAGMTTM